MVGTIELDPTGQHLLIRFPYREDLIDVVRTLPDRRWDPAHKVWTVPAGHVDSVVTTLIGRGFTMDSGVSAMFAGTTPKPAVPKASERPPRPPGTGSDRKPGRRFRRGEPRTARDGE
jgi:exodeoxyribonuclease VII large subunit